MLGALWGAIARVQEIVSQRTKGAIRFGGDAPEGAIALAPWLHQDLPGADRMAGRGRGAAADVRLNGRRVVVADDDPGVTWFISDLLRTAGCEVHEALDGATALDIAFRVQPELVVSDILMPGLDGFALCRALRRDVGLRDTPVMLLSWKEDLLQRVRELGASAAAYMRKESDSRAVLARVREVLRPRARIEMRLRGDGEVRGRLDDLSPRLLLELVCAIRKDARVAVRDATFFYEVEIRGGAPRKATRTASDGSFRSGERALAMLLAVGAGRFSIASSQEPIRGELTGTLFELLARPLAAARGALAATTGQRTMDVERIVLDPSRARGVPAGDARSGARGPQTPGRRRVAARAAARGRGGAEPCRGAARRPRRPLRDPRRGGADGTDLLTPAVDAALAVLTGAIPPSRSMPPNARPSVAPRPAVLPVRAPTRPACSTWAARSSRPACRMSPPRSILRRPLRSPCPTLPRARSRACSGRRRRSHRGRRSDPLRAACPSARWRLRRGSSTTTMTSGAPSSLEDAVMREISDRSPEPSPVLGGLDLPPIVEPSELRPRSSNPPANEEDAREPPDEQAFLPSIPPDAIVPAASSNEEFAVAAPGEAAASQVEEAFQLTSEKRLVAREREPRAQPGAERGSEGRRGGARTHEEAVAEPETRKGDEASPPRDAMAAAPAIVSLPPEDLHEVPEEPRGRVVPASEPPAASSSPWGFVVAFALLAGAVVAVLRMTGRDLEPQWPSVAPAPMASPASTGTTLTGAAGAASSGAAGAATIPSSSARAAAAPLGSAAPSSMASAAASPSASASSAARGGAASDDALPPGAAIPAGYGLLEIGAPRGARVLVDGVDAGSGPLSSSVQRAGYHQVRIDQDGKRSQYVIEVRAGKTTRVKSSPLP